MITFSISGVETTSDPVPPSSNSVSPLDELVGEKVTPENTRIYICGYQGTIDGVMDYVSDRGFVNRDNPHEDGTFEVKYESYG